jgi:hypothetical protein
MKTLALAALLGTLAFDQVQGVQLSYADDADDLVAVDDEDMYNDDDAAADAQGD